MRAVWLSSTYYLDEAVGKLSANAERLLTRSMAHCGNAETSGYISEQAITMLGLPNPKKLARELVDANIYVPRPGGGWDLRSWDAWNSAGDALLARRKADRERQAKRRAEQRKSRGQSRDTQKASGADGSLYSSVELEKNSELPTSTTTTSEDGSETKILADVPERKAVSRNMSRDVTAPEESRGEKISGYVDLEATDPYGSGISATPGANLVREIVPKGHPPATLTSLRIQASELINQGAEPDVVRTALQLWCDKPNVGIGRTILSSLYSEAIKTRAAPRPNPQTGNGLTAGESKVAGWAALGQPSAPHLKAINE